MTTESTSKHGSQPIVVVGRGQIGTPLVARLAAAGQRVIWVSRSVPAQLPEGVTHHAVDATRPEELASVARGARAMIAAVNPPSYDAKVWAATLPPLHRGLIEAAALSGVRLVMLDALYLYRFAEGDGPLAPSSPREPTTAKGKIRKQTADLLLEAQRAGRVRASTLRAPDFWGPGLTQAILTSDGLAKLAHGGAPLLVGNPDVVHAFSHRDDVVEALITLALADDDVEGKVFHAPVAHFTPRALVAAVAGALSVKPRAFVAPGWLVRLLGVFSRDVRGLVEMLPQWTRPYLVDDSAYRARFGAEATSLAEGAAQLASGLVARTAA